MKNWHFRLYLLLFIAFIAAIIIDWVSGNIFGASQCVQSAWCVLILMELADIRSEIK